MARTTISPCPKGQLRAVVSGRQKVAIAVGHPTVDIRYVAQAALAAEVDGWTGERYIIANEYVEARDFFALAVALRGATPPKLMPYRVAYEVAVVAERIAR